MTPSRDREARHVVETAVVVSPADPGVGGLGSAAADFAAGLRAEGVVTRYVGQQPPSTLTRVSNGRLSRRLSGGWARRAAATDVRKAVPRAAWDLQYAIAGSAPTKRRPDDGLVVLHQSTHFPLLEFERLRAGRSETGGRADLDRIELRRRMREIERADIIHVTTEAVRAQFLAAGVADEKLVVAHLGVDLARFTAAPKPDGLRMGHVGAFSMRKGVDVVAELAARLGRDQPVIAVGGPVCRWSRTVVEEANFVRWDSVADMLRACHVLLLPSRSDAFAYVVLEAMASGTVPIVTPEVGAAEVVRRLDPRLVVDRNGFADSVLRLLPDLDLATLGGAAARLAQDFDAERMGRLAARRVLDRVREGSTA